MHVEKADNAIATMSFPPHRLTRLLHLYWYTNRSCHEVLLSTETTHRRRWPSLPFLPPLHNQHRHLECLTVSPSPPLSSVEVEH